MLWASDGIPRYVISIIQVMVQAKLHFGNVEYFFFWFLWLGALHVPLIALS